MHRRRFVAHALAVPLAGCAFRPFAAPRELVVERLGASTACLAGYSLIDAFHELLRLGFETVEVIAFTGARHSVGEIPGFALHEASARQREEVFEVTRSFRHISAHLPFQDISLFSASADRRRAGLEQVRAALDGLAFLRGEFGVMHLGWPDQGLTYRDIRPLIVDTLRALGDYAGERGLRIGVETMQPASIHEYADMIFAIDHPRVGATIDTGHIRGASDIALEGEQRFTPEGRARFNDALDDLVAVLGDKVLHFHLADVRPTDWMDHRTVGSGIIDFPRLFARLHRTDYSGLLIFELEEQDRVGSLRASREHVRRVLTAEGWTMRGASARDAGEEGNLWA